MPVLQIKTQELQISGAMPLRAPEYTVAEISMALKRTLEATYSTVRVRGEISGLKRHTSGHLYFSLKDQEAVIDGVCWRGTYGRFPMMPEDGLEMICTGRITTFPGRSKYQMVVEMMEPAGEGALLKVLEERKRRLAQEGLFAPERKKALPRLPSLIGIVTSPTGAVIRDMLHRLEERCPTPVLLWPVLVQGEGAAEQIAAAIQGFNTLWQGGAIPRPDLLIVARGGGSIEDLWAFNEEIVVRAAASSHIPLISAVGHETDTTLIDYAADYRAPTPTAAAERAVPVRSELMATLGDYGRRLAALSQRYILEREQAVARLARGITLLPRIVEDFMLRLDERSERFIKALQRLVEQRETLLSHRASQLRHPRERLKLAEDALLRTQEHLRRAINLHLASCEQRLTTQSLLLESYSYHATLKRGFAVVKNGRGEIITSAQAATQETALNLVFQDGEIKVSSSKRS